MKFRLWGTRGSIPSPLRTEDIEAKIQTVLLAAAEAGVDMSDPTAVRAFIASLPHATRGTAGGDTACVELRSAGNLLIFDCGSGMRRLGLELMKEEFGRGKGVAHIFMCHTHWDHMMGWPFFNPSYVPGNKFYIYGVHPDLEERFRIQQTSPRMFPISLDYHAAELNFVTLQEGQTIQIGQTRVSNLLFHHPGDSYGYRVEDDDGIFIYAGDSEYKTLDPAATRSYVEFFRDADALIFDAMFSLHDSYLFEDWGHSSAVAGADLATRAGARRLLLFHHAPVSTDEQVWSLRDIADEYLKQHPDRPPCEVIVAYDGLEMELWREAKLQARLESLPQGIAVHLSGRLVAETAPTALTAIEQAKTHAGNLPVVVDLSEVIHVSQDGLKALFSARRRWCPLALSGLNSEVRRTLAKADALDYFATFEISHNAVLTLNQGGITRPGQVLGDRYAIGEQIGRNPLGHYYRATDRALNREVIIQTLCPGLGRAPTKALIQTAQTTTTLQHPLIVKTLDVGRDGHIHYLALEYISDRSVRHLLMPPSVPHKQSRSPRTTAPRNAQDSPKATRTDDRPTPLSPAQAMRIALQIAQALEYAHSQGFVHGALKPEHIILSEDSIKVSHFGIGRLDINRPLSELPAHMGTLDYLAPEQLQGRGNSPASDLYALGTILYEMLTGHTPFAATTNDEDLISLQLHQPPVPPRRRNPNLSRSLEYLVLSLLKKSPRERPANAGVVRQVLISLAPQPYDGLLLGRDLLHQKLRTHVERVVQGQSGLLVVQGQRGIGKTHLVLAIADQGPEDQHIILHADLFADEDTRPYKLFVKALRHTLLNLPAHQLTHLLKGLNDLAPPLTALIPDLQPRLSAFALPEIDCRHLEQAICETIRLLTAQGPVTLILDSLQWIDVASLRLLDRLASQRIPRLLIVALYRSDEVDQHHPLHRTLDALEPWIDERLDIPPLSPIDVHQMASTLNMSRELPPDFGLWLYGETDGNPLHIEQLIQAYLEGSGETRRPHERATAITLEDVIQRRLERLPEGVLVTLRQAAVLGHSFSFDKLRLALDQSERQVLINLNKALQARLVVENPVEHQYSFSHPLIREVTYREMLEGTRKRYHRQAVRVLELDGPLGVMDEKIDLLAHHLLRAGENEKAVAYLARATRRARELCAYESALGYIDQALAVVERLLQIATNKEEQTHRQNQRDDLLNAQARLQQALAQSKQPSPNPPQG